MRSILLGYGYWGKIVKKYIESSNKFELVGICDPNLEDSIKIEQIWERGDIDCVFLCVPVNIHYDLVKLMLEHGIHVFCEKPLCRKSKEAEELLLLAKEKKCTLYTDYIYTVSPSINYIKEHLYELGNINYIDMRIKQFGRFYEEDHVFEVIGVHMISALVYLLDENANDIKITTAEIIKRSERKLPEVGNVRFEAGSIKGKIECSLWAAEKERKIEILCEHGMIIFDMMGQNTVRIVKNSKEEGQRIIFEKKYDENNNLEHMLNSFFDTIISKNQTNMNITKMTAEIIEQINNFIYLEGNKHEI